MTGVRIRTAAVEDLPGVIALERGTAEAPHWGESEYAAMIGGGESGYVRRRLLVAEAEGVLVGFAAGKVADDVAELESVAVDSRARRRGVGRALCESVIEWSRQQGASAIELEVRAGSAGAIHLYRGMGFVVVGRRRGYYSDPPDDAVLMRLNLAEGPSFALPLPEKLW
ncbi:MAG TPA: GNAT family N-acetyltransferase [Edaphobacter sp.]|nr:GNAT family N-acetyltransferase [Edaphobacter sp.]